MSEARYRVVDLHSTFQVQVDYGTDWQLALSVPSGRLAGYEEARVRGEARHREDIVAYLAGCGQVWNQETGEVSRAATAGRLSR